MNASKFAKILAIVPLALFVTECNIEQPPPPSEDMVRAVICDGRPYWCVRAKSEMDGLRPAYVYIDGKEKGIILPGTTLVVPVKAGETHKVNFCAYSDVAKSKQWKCSTPTDTKFDSGDLVMVVFPQK